MITLSSVDTSVTFRVPIIDDLIPELTEQFSVALSVVGVLPVGVRLEPSEAGVTITDTDTVVIGFRPYTYTVVENAGEVELTVEVISGVLPGTVTLSYRTLDGTATAPTDYTDSTDMITLSSVDTSVTFRVPIIDDLIPELTEQFSVALSVVGVLPVGVRLEPSEAGVTITDTDTVVIGFRPYTHIVVENAGEVTLTVEVISGVLPGAVTLSYKTLDGTATAPTDYTDSTDMITLSSVNTSVKFTVPITDDLIPELTEQFSVALSVVGVLPVGVMLEPAEAGVTILDDDTVVIGFRPYTYTVVENAGEVELTVEVISGMLTETVTLSYRTLDGTATAPTDYTDSTDTITLSSVNTSVTFTVPITDDGVAEINETFTVVLSSVGDLPFGVILIPTVATVTIPDIADAIINPGDMGRFCDIHNSATDLQACVRVNSMISTGPLALVIEYIGIRSQADSIIEMGLLPFDMTVLPKVPVWEIYFEDANGNRVQTLSNTVEVDFTIPRDLVDDNVNVDVGDVSIGVLRAGSMNWLIRPTSYDDTVSSSYSFTVSIDSFSFFTLMVPQELSIGIVHDDNVIVEGENAVVTVSLSMVARKTVTVQLTGLLMTGGDYADRNDYRLSTTNVVILANSRESTFTLDAVLDSLVEGVERLELQASAARLTSDQRTVTIQDLALERLSSATIVEGDSTEIIVRLSNIATVPVRVSLARVGGRAASNDYRLSPASVVIPVGSREAVFTVMANYDGDAESDETLEFEATAEADGVQLNKVRSTVTIREISISIEGIGTEIREGVNRVVRVRLSNIATVPVMVSLARVGGTATSNDYRLSPASVVIPVGSRGDVFTVMANYDGGAESDETLVFEATAEADGVQLNKVRSTVTIKDISISIEGIGTEIREGVNRVVTVRLSNPAINSIRVSLAQIGGTASIDDYTFPEYVDIAAGDLTSMFDLRTTLDNIPEGVFDRDDKLDGKEGLRFEAHAEVLLPRPVNLNRARRTVTLLDTSVEIGGILDVGGSIEEIEGVMEIAEGTPITVRVTLSEVASDEITVLLEDIEVGGTAEDNDYTLLPGDNVIQPGDMTATFILTAIDDGLEESNESLELSIGYARLRLIILGILGYDNGLVLPPTGGPALPVWLVGVLTLVGVLAVVVSLGGLLGRRRNRV